MTGTIEAALLRVLDNPQEVWGSVLNAMPRRRVLTLLKLCVLRTPTALARYRAECAAISDDNAMHFEEDLEVLDDMFLRTMRHYTGRFSVDFVNPTIQDFCIDYLNRNVSLGYLLIRGEVDSASAARWFELARAVRPASEADLLAGQIGMICRYPALRDIVVDQGERLLAALVSSSMEVGNIPTLLDEAAYCRSVRQCLLAYETLDSPDASKEMMRGLLRHVQNFWRDGKAWDLVEDSPAGNIVRAHYSVGLDSSFTSIRDDLLDYGYTFKRFARLARLEKLMLPKDRSVDYWWSYFQQAVEDLAQDIGIPSSTDDYWSELVHSFEYEDFNNLRDQWSSIWATYRETGRTQSHAADNIQYLVDELAEIYPDEDDQDPPPDTPKEEGDGTRDREIVALFSGLVQEE